MKLAFVDLCGFRGYRKQLRVTFGERLTIIDGRNGVGKSTIFDAVEFVLTGTIGKYNDAKSAGETVADYIWWRGDGSPPAERYVEVGFTDGDVEISVRRTEFGGIDTDQLQAIADLLCDRELAPDEPLIQLCSTSIIRDEHIAGLSLDLKETDRYALLRDALGANDAESWIARGAQIAALAKRRAATAQQDVTTLNSEVAIAGRRIDEVRARLVAESAVAEAVARLRLFTGSEAPADQLGGPTRERIAEATSELEDLDRLKAEWVEIEFERTNLGALATAINVAQLASDEAIAVVDDLGPAPEPIPSSDLAQQARDFIALVALGRHLGLQDGNCPLCAAEQSPKRFQDGLATAEALAMQLDAQAAKLVEHEVAVEAAQAKVSETTQALVLALSAHVAARARVDDFDRELQARGFTREVKLGDVNTRYDELALVLASARNDLRILQTLNLSADLERAQQAQTEATERLTRAQERFGRTRKAEAAAQALHDASRRAAAETLDSRLDRVLPLMSELYRRLRPHPIWRDIEYSIRGDVRRFLKLQVGEELNPQFLFSSGQRRATGLAFLLSVNLSLAWSKWRSILLDDPVQHVDDFRTVHLAEVTAQLVADGRQLVCAVEDAALADLLCRRLPVVAPGDGVRITLGPDAGGDLAKLDERQLSPLARRSLLAGVSEAATA